MGRTLAELRAEPSAPRVLRPGARPRSLGLAPLTPDERAELRMLEAEIGPVRRPRTLAECPIGPCPFVGCRYHLYLEVNEETGALKLIFPHLEVWELPETCAIRAADRGALSLDEVGRLTNRSQQGVVKIERPALAKVADRSADLAPASRNRHREVEAGST